VDNSVVNVSHFALTHCPLWSFIKLTKKWPDFFQQTAKPPETVDEVVEILTPILGADEKTTIEAIREEDLTDLHFELGMAISNAFGLHEPGSQLSVSCGAAHPDDESEMAVKMLWR
jgi:hypothetical protein